jgi:hypothetical protein
MTMRKLLGILLFMLPLAAVAQSGITGTWRIDESKTQLDPKPRVFVLKDGMFSCSCDPNVTIKADGKDQKVNGSPYEDTESATVNGNTVEVVGKKDGKVAFRVSMTIAPDGKSMTRKFEEHPTGSEQVVTFDSVYARVGEPEAGAHALSGSWKREKLESSENGLSFAYTFTGDGVNYKASDGESYSAKFDGKDYPYMGDPSTTTVALKKIDDQTFEETDKNNGNVIAVTRISISSDGKALTMLSQDTREGITNTFVADKQGMEEAGK